jgi:two-component system, OmpR family, osmolarity sensor histidine kinase EnvZ
MIPKTLFARTALTISALLLIFVLLASSVIFYYIMTPMVRQSASHLAALVSLSAQTWVELPPDTRRDFESELESQHNIILLSQKKQNLQSNSIHTPFFHFFKEEIQAHLGEQVEVMEEFTPEFWIWVKIPIASWTLYIGFSHAVIGPDPPLAMFILICAGAILVIVSSLFLVNYLVRPLNHLLIATKKIGQGGVPEPLAEIGPQELVQLTRSFNTMNTQIQELLQNRTILLAGISHDLRTPIARIHLALELLDKQQDQSLVNGINNDLREINQLIQHTLDFSKGLDVASQDYQTIEINSYIEKYIQLHPHSSLINFIVEKGSPGNKNDKRCQLTIPVNVLDRVLNNLLENAIRYSHYQPVIIKSKCLPGNYSISLIDQGGGIPEDQLKAVFQPFYRLETSRNSETGGSGLGLAIVQQLCKAYGWEIKLKNIKNQGTEAILKIKLQS